MTITTKQLSQSLKNGEEKRLYLLIGNDEYSIRYGAEQIVESAGEREILRFDALAFDRDQLEEAFFSFPLFYGRLLLIDNFKLGSLPSEDAALFEELLKEIPDFLTVVLQNYVEGRFSVSKQIEKLFAAVPSSLIVVAEQKSGSDAISMVTEMSLQEGARIDRDAAARLLELLGDDLMMAKAELKKLSALCNYGTIERSHVDRLTVKSTESSVFDMIGALELKDIKKASEILSEMLNDRTEPLAITASLNTAYINLFRAKSAVTNRLKENDLFSMFDYKKGDRKVSIAMNRERGYTREQLTKIIDLLYQLDLELKSSPVDRALLLEQAVIEIAMTRG